VIFLDVLFDHVRGGHPFMSLLLEMLVRASDHHDRQSSIALEQARRSGNTRSSAADGDDIWVDLLALTL